MAKLPLFVWFSAAYQMAPVIVRHLCPGFQNRVGMGGVITVSDLRLLAHKVHDQHGRPFTASLIAFRAWWKRRVPAFQAGP